MNSETKKCANCRNEFVIEPEDFQFYKKIDAPPPTWCPECRMVRRFFWRNERALKKGICKLCKKSMLSMYDAESGIQTYCQECWWSDSWSPMEYGLDYDFSTPFFGQLKRLVYCVPYMGLQIRNSVDTEYANFVADGKNIYMSFSAVEGSEDIFYSKNIDASRKVIDSFELSNSESCYEGIKGDKNYNSKFIFDCRGCIDSSFLFDCVNCQNCFMSSNLRNKNYYFKNKQYTKDEYKRFIDDIDHGSYKELEKLKREYEEMKVSSIRKYASMVNCVNFSGDDVRDSKKAFYAFSGYGYENVKYIFRSLDVKDSMDTVNAAHVELFYEFMAGGGNGGQNVKFVFSALPALVNVEYVQYSGSSSHLFGCIGLRNKQYCILNKQYTKEEYEVLLPKIKKHMTDMPYIDQKGRVYRYGEFFPTELSPFAYNETIAQEYFPLTKEHALEKGYAWRDPDTKDYIPTILSKDLPDSISDVPDSITKEIVQCANAINPDAQRDHSADPKTSACTTAFRIIPEELSFYKRMNLPLPRLCPNCRHYERLSQRNPLKLWHRTCACGGRKSQSSNNKSQYENTATHEHGDKPCQNEFETSYAPERPEIVYCESCYQREIV